MEVKKPLPNVDEIVRTTPYPHLPMFCIRPNTLISTANLFVSSFKLGDVLYAVKCSAKTEILERLWEGGVRHFDCASVKECQVIRNLFGPTAGVHFLHPIKSREDIREVYTTCSVKTFALDTTAELEKIIDVTGGNDHDLAIIIRLALPSCSKEGDAIDDHMDVHYPLSGKFGIEGIEEAATLLRLARSRARRVGVSFHVGSQCTDPIIYTRALDHVNDVLIAADVPIEIVDVGGGFPIQYDTKTTVISLHKYIETIERAFRKLPQILTGNACLWCEPGRALVAAGGSLVIRVEDRRLKSNISVLYVNDGIFGSLQDTLSVLRWPFPVRLLRSSTANKEPFAFFGPTCDTSDFMPGPFLLPSDVRAGDHIEIGQLGAYSTCFQTSFNGFDRVRTEFVCDGPMLQTSGHVNILDRTEQSASSSD